MLLMANILTFKAKYSPDIQEDVLQHQDYVLPLEMPCYKVVVPYHQTLPDPLWPISHRCNSESIAVRISIVRGNQ